MAARNPRFANSTYTAMETLSYTRTARALHWLITVGIGAAVVLALSFDNMPLSPRKIHLINYHKWTGLTVLWLTAARIAWRMRHRPPQLPATLAAWERHAAQLMHVLLYALTVVTPLLGWWLSSAKGFPIKYLGLVPLPDLAAKDRAAAEFLQPLHMFAAWSLVGLVALHVAATLKHQVVDQVPLLRRMA
jgi:cytochrome b561